MNPIFFAASFLLSLYTTTVFAVENKTLIDRVVAIINSEPILLSDLKLVEKNLSKPGLIDETLITPYKIEDLKSNTKAQLNYLINEKLLSTEIKKLNLSVSADRVEQEIASMAKRAGASKEDLLNAIRSQGISTLEYKTFLKDKIEKQSLVQQEVISKIRISDDEILNEYLKTNKKNNNKVNEFSLAHVFFN
ncbi:MAG TPA: SurA N-terminal domain-containing protein, partial [Pseudobdellovibrionaceae bacterium]|nr:SurA N-terminal domain-containing protein [Pseudobdellovibrionaceae bacterium]